MTRYRKGLLTSLMLFGACGLGLRDAGAATISVTANLTASETWTSNNEYILTKPIYVTNGATLTIGPGTVIRGNPESSPGAHDPGTLIIARGSKIRAMGTAAQPIVFTDLFDDNIGSNPGSFPYDTLENAMGTTAQWGGLILLGRTYVANNTLAGPNPAREVQIEGLDPAGGLGLYGNGGNDDDDSGIVNYVSIRYGGFNLSANNEINGLTLGGVGRQTQIDYVDVMQTKDDFVECFGGTVNLKHVSGAVGGDDGLDLDEGYRGKVQFLFIMQGTPGADKNDKGGEWDGGNGPDGSQPFTIPTIYNATFVGLGQKPFSASLMNLGAVFRDNAGGRVYNSFWADFGGAPVLIEGGVAAAIEPNTSAERSTTAYTVTPPFYLNPPSAFQLELQNDEWWCMGNGGAVPTGNATAFGGVAGQIHYDPGVFTNASLNNRYGSCATPLPIRSMKRGNNPSPGAPDPIVSIDPRPAPGGPLLTGVRATPADGFFEPASYRGAFGPGRDWVAGWSTLSRLGYVPVCDPASAPNAVPDEVSSVSVLDRLSMTWSPLSFNTTGYDVVRVTRSAMTAPVDFADASRVCVETGDVDQAAVDATANPPAGSAFFYQVRARNACGVGPLGYASSGVEEVSPACP